MPQAELDTIIHRLLPQVLADRDLGSYVVSAAGSLLGLGGAVSVYAIGGDLEANYSFDSNNDGASSSYNALTGKDQDGNQTGTTAGFADSQMQAGDISDLLDDLIGGVGTLLGLDDQHDAAATAKTSFN